MLGSTLCSCRVLTGSVMASNDDTRFPLVNWRRPTTSIRPPDAHIVLHIAYERVRAVPLTGKCFSLTLLLVGFRTSRERCILAGNWVRGLGYPMASTRRETSNPLLLHPSLPQLSLLQITSGWVFYGQRV